MKIKDFFFQKRFAVKVTQGQIGNKKEPYYLIWKEEEPCVVSVNKRKYYFLGASESSYDEVSQARALTGAAVGALFSPVGALIGGAIGSKKQTKTKYTIGFVDIETDEIFTIEAEMKPIEIMKLKHFEVYALPEKGASDTNPSKVGELREFKQLLDDGIITEDEFNDKKKQLLS